MILYNINSYILIKIFIVIVYESCDFYCVLIDYLCEKRIIY